MKTKAALKTVRKCVDYYIKKRLSFDANLFEKGLIESEHTKRCFEERKKILQAMEILEKPDGKEKGKDQI